MTTDLNGIKEIDIKDSRKALEVLNLQQAAYHVEADLLGSKDIPPLTESLESLMESGESFLGYYIQGVLVAALAYRRIDEEVDICRVMVHPHHFRKRIAITLLEYLERQETDAKNILVSTGAANGPAIRLYQKLGFEFIDETVVEHGLKLAHLKKQKVQ